MMPPIFTVAVQCHNFQRRFAWMLSSLAQQTQRSLIVVDVAFVANNGKPTTEELVAEFRDRISIRSTVFADFDQFQYRGLVRNRQLQECATPWLLFGDCDMVYHPDYFRRLRELLDADHKDATYMLSSGRTSNPKEQTEELVRKWTGPSAEEVVAAWPKADALPKVPMRNVGAGFCQLVNYHHCPHGGYYVKPQENRDSSWRKGSNPRSDVQFRRRVSAGGNHRRNLPDWFSENAIHLNHDRDPDAGRHLESQR